MDYIADNIIASGAPAYIVGILLLLVGALECFWGYSIFKIQVGIVCFLAGLGIGYVGVYRAFGNWIAALVVGIVLAIVLCVLAVKIFNAGVFLFVGFFAFFISEMLLATYWEHSIWLSLIIAVAAGIIGMFLAKPFIIIFSAIGGGGIAARGIYILLGSLLGAQSWIYVASWVIGAVLAVLGAILQFRKNRNTPVPT